MPIKTMTDLFIEELRDIYHAERQLVRALPKVAKAATAQELKNGVLRHLEQTKGQVERLEQVFESLDTRARGRPCEAMQGLIEEAQEMIEEHMPGELLDVALIAGAQKIEHYEIASYGSLIAYAKALGHQEAQRLLEETLAEEKDTDSKLTQLAVTLINQKALKTVS
jgi:ferritin-like metal-binding protein YciE